MPSIALTQDLRPGFRLEASLGYALRQAGQHHAQLVQSLLPPGLTAPQFTVLVKLYELGSCSQNQLGRHVLMDAATIKGVVDRLRRRDLIEAIADPLDRRRIMLSLSEEGFCLAGELAHAIESAEDGMLGHLDAGEQAQLTALLAKMCQ
ncbi:transcriptional regulator, MarR family [Arboricoccus pini]|uniref:Transcriptional regulator, MarR family n=1 Tax=Arboricoccus pini TaxID=1963835 RepID=A0A212RJ12_9PROT|nr:MarR family transcriptional regulator [Arboricoccus pini]SNB72418.1 transcriptional regulator, MarR family [Arboricoccus pini]